MFLLKSLLENPWLSEVDRRFKYLISSRPIEMYPKNLRYDKQYMLHRFFTESSRGSDLSKVERTTTTMPFYSGNVHLEKKKASILKNPQSGQNYSSSESKSETQKSKDREKHSQVVFALKKKSSKTESCSTSESEKPNPFKIRRKPTKKNCKSRLNKTNSSQSSYNSKEYANSEPQKSSANSSKTSEKSGNSKVSSGINEASLADNETGSTRESQSSKPNDRSNHDNKSSASGENSRMSNNSENSNKSGNKNEESSLSAPSRSQEIIKLLDKTYISPLTGSSFQSNSILVSNPTSVSYTNSISNPTHTSYTTSVSNPTHTSYTNSISNPTHTSYTNSISNPTHTSYITSISNPTHTSYTTSISNNDTFSSHPVSTSNPTSFSNPTINSDKTSPSSKIDQGTQSDLSGTGKSYDTNDFQSEYPEKKFRNNKSAISQSGRSTRAHSMKALRSNAPQSRKKSSETRKSNDRNKSSTEPSRKYTSSTAHSSRYTGISGMSAKSGLEFPDGIAEYKPSKAKSPKIYPSCKSKISNYTNHSNSSNNSKGVDLLDIDDSQSEIITKNQKIDNDNNLDVTFSEILDGEEREIRKMYINKTKSKLHDNLQWDVYPIKRNSVTSANKFAERLGSEDPKQSETSTHLIRMTGDSNLTEGRFKNKVRSASNSKKDVTRFLMEVQKYDSAPSVSECLKIDEIESLDSQHQLRINQESTSKSTFTTYPTSLSTRHLSSQALTCFSENSLETDAKTGNSSTSRKLSLSEIPRKISSKDLQITKIHKVSSLTDASSRSHRSNDDLPLHSCPSATNLSTHSSTIDKNCHYGQGSQKSDKNSEKKSFSGYLAAFGKVVLNFNQRTKGSKRLAQSPLRYSSRIFKPFYTSSEETIISDPGSRGSTFESDTEDDVEPADARFTQEMGGSKHYLFRKNIQSQPSINTIRKYQSKGKKSRRPKHFRSLPLAYLFKTRQSIKIE